MLTQWTDSGCLEMLQSIIWLKKKVIYRTSVHSLSLPLKTPHKSKRQMH